MVSLVQASTMLVSVMARVGEVLASQEAGSEGSGDFRTTTKQKEQEKNLQKEL